MFCVLKNESSNKRKIGYPFIIRVNGKSNIKKAKTLLSDKLKKEYISKLNSCVYDCKTKSQCIETVNLLKKNKIKNLDLGPYQTNYKFHKYKMENYFSLQTSFLIACKYQHELVNRFGYSWDTIARYHSSTPKLNNRYKKSLLRNYKKLQDKKQ